MTEDLNELFRKITNDLAEMKSEIRALVEMQKDGTTSRARLTAEMHEVDKRMTLVEREITQIRQMVEKLDAQRAAEAPGKAKLAVWITILAFVVTAIVTALSSIIPQAFLGWWRGSP